MSNESLGEECPALVGGVRKVQSREGKGEWRGPRVPRRVGGDKAAVLTPGRQELYSAPATITSFHF